MASLVTVVAHAPPMRCTASCSSTPLLSRLPLVEEVAGQRGQTRPLRRVGGGSVPQQQQHGDELGPRAADRPQADAVREGFGRDGRKLVAPRLAGVGQGRAVRGDHDTARRLRTRQGRGPRAGRHDGQRHATLRRQPRRRGAHSPAVRPPVAGQVGGEVARRPRQHVVAVQLIGPPPEPADPLQGTRHRSLHAAHDASQLVRARSVLGQAGQLVRHDRLHVGRPGRRRDRGRDHEQAPPPRGNPARR